MAVVLNGGGETDVIEAPIESASVVPSQVLAFKAGDEEYAIDILQVQEIRGFERPTRIAGSGDAVCGVTNLRGTVVPIIDLRVLLGLRDAGYQASTVSIIVNLGGRVVGLVVDSVSDVLDIDLEAVRPPPDMDGPSAAGEIVGLVSLPDRMLIVLALDRRLGTPVRD